MKYALGFARGFSTKANLNSLIKAGRGEEALMQAKRDKSLLSQPDETGHKPLDWALMGKHHNIAKELLNLDVNFTERNPVTGLTSLHLAVKQGDRSLLDLFKPQLKPNQIWQIRDSKGRSALHIAAEYGYADMVVELVEEYDHLLTVLDNSGKSAYRAMLENKAHNLQIADYLHVHLSLFLQFAVKEQDSQTIEAALTAGADPLYQYTLYTSEIVGQSKRIKIQSAKDSAFEIAVKLNLIEIVEMFQKLGACKNVEFKTGNTPLHTAIDMGFIEMAKLLATDKSMLVRKNNRGQTPYDVAKSMGLKELLDCLYVEAKPTKMLGSPSQIKVTKTNKTQADDVKKKHIINACHTADKSMIVLFGDSNHSFDFNYVGQVPIVVALRSKSYEIVDLLLKYHARVDVVDAKGGTILHAIINMPNWNNRHKTSLSFQEDADELLCIRKLIEHGADPHKKNGIGVSAIEYASAKGFRLLAEVMRETALECKGVAR